MIFVRIAEETATKAMVYFQHNFPDDLTEEELADGLLVDSVPEPTPQDGKMALLYINPITKELWYEYVDRPLTSEEETKKRITQLEEQLKITQDALDALLLG